MHRTKIYKGILLLTFISITWMFPNTINSQINSSPE